MVDRRLRQAVVGLRIADNCRVRYLIGITLIVIGLVSLLVGGFRWKQEKTVIDIGPLKAQTEEHKVLPIPPAVGVLALVGGVAVLVVPMKRRV
jgi:uncharacterized membrane protein YidH (DUF202 family)